MLAEARKDFISMIDREVSFSTSVMKQMDLFKAVVNCIRDIRIAHNIKPSAITPMEVYFANYVQKNWFLLNGYGVSAFIKGPVAWLDIPQTPIVKRAGVIIGVVPHELSPVEIHVDLGKLINPHQEVFNIEKEIASHTKEITKLDVMLNNKHFTNRAPSQLVLKTQTTRDSLVESLARLKSQLKGIET